MWKRFANRFRCPLCLGALELSAFAQQRVIVDDSYLERAAEQNVLDDDFSVYIDAGMFCCDRCEVAFPIFKGLPVLLPYATKLNEQFAHEWSAELRRMPRRVRFPDRAPVPGERFVLSSFSTEWLAYDFDGVIWEMSYSDHEKRFLAELGAYRPVAGQGMFLELGCGIGITTDLAQKNFGVDALGVDLSLAALRATQRFRANPFLHFVQASVFYLPLPHDAFETVYSRGVLHHTYSTAEAFASLARFCREGGTTYLWVYGPKSINDNGLRRSLYLAERTIRRLLRGRDSGLLASAILYPLAGAYVLFNRARTAGDPTVQRYNFQRALHAARDRFTPEFAHRHDFSEVSEWFAQAGFTNVEVVDWRSMPSADHDDYRRNTGVRGRKSLVAPLPIRARVAVPKAGTTQPQIAKS